MLERIVAKARRVGAARSGARAHATGPARRGATRASIFGKDQRSFREFTGRKRLFGGPITLVRRTRREGYSARNKEENLPQPGINRHPGALRRRAVGGDGRISGRHEDKQPPSPGSGAEALGSNLASRITDRLPNDQPRSERVRPDSSHNHLTFGTGRRISYVHYANSRHTLAHHGPKRAARSQHLFWSPLRVKVDPPSQMKTRTNWMSQSSGPWFQLTPASSTHRPEISTS